MKALRAMGWGVVKGWPMALVGGLSAAVLFGGFVLWLRIPEAHAWQLVASAVTGLLWLFCALWVVAAGLAYFRRFHQEGVRCLGRAFGGTWKRVPWLLLWAVVMVLVWRWIAGYGESTQAWADYLRSVSPLWLRKWWSAAQLDHAFTRLLWAARWWIVPALLLPWAVAWTTRGMGTWSTAAADWKRAVRCGAYWVALLIGVLLLVEVPDYLVDWRPKVEGIRWEAVSMVLRLLAGYGLALVGAVLATSAAAYVPCRIEEPSAEAGGEPAS